MASLSAPWFTFYREIEALFKDDDEVDVVYDDDEKVLDIHVAKYQKAEALMRLLPTTREFGNVTVTINVIQDVNEDPSVESVFEDAFAGNPAVYSVETRRLFDGEVTYVVFEPEVVQFFNDDVSDIDGKRSTLYQDIAKNVFKGDGVFFCTAKESGHITSRYPF